VERGSLKVLLVIALSAALTLASAHATMNPQENVSLYTGNSLRVRADQTVIRTVVVEGNLTAATLFPNNYPSKNFTLTTNSTQQYTVTLWLSNPSPYTAYVETLDPVQRTTSQVTSYYVSSGDLNLTIYAAFQPGPSSGTGPPFTFGSFYSWLGQFGGAFPVWIKILYAVLGVQFAFVGRRWIRFEDERRRTDGHLPPLDNGNKIYLWTDIAFHALLAGFAISLIVMVGELLVIVVAQYLLFVNLSLISLLDFFSLFFFVVVASLLYLSREGMERFLDLKPIMED
jgi:hypothetical protein